MKKNIIWNKYIDLLELKASKVHPEYGGKWLAYFDENNQYIDSSKHVLYFSYIKCGLCDMIFMHGNHMSIFSEEHVVGHIKEFNLLPFI